MSIHDHLPWGRTAPVRANTRTHTPRGRASARPRRQGDDGVAGGGTALLNAHGAFRRLGRCHSQRSVGAQLSANTRNEVATVCNRQSGSTILQPSHRTAVDVGCRFRRALAYQHWPTSGYVGRTNRGGRDQITRRVRRGRDRCGQSTEMDERALGMGVRPASGADARSQRVPHDDTVVIARLTRASALLRRGDYFAAVRVRLTVPIMPGKRFKLLGRACAIGADPAR